MVTLKYIFSLSIILFTISIAMDKTVQETLAMVKAQQILRPSTPLNPYNNNHAAYIKLLQTPDGRKVTVLDVYTYLGFEPSR